MGWQLWSSPETGYRRVGTRFQDVRELFSSGITVKSIYEPLKSCPIKAYASELKRELERRDFDLAGVIDEHKNVIGFIKTNQLGRGRVSDYVEAFNSSHLISDSTPIPELYAELLEHKYLFVLSGAKIHGIVTLSDLNKPPNRIYVFGIISLLEMHLTYWINKCFPDEQWLRMISENRLEMARQLFEEKSAKNQELDLVNCLQFSDKKMIVAKSSALRSKLSIGNRKSVLDKLKHAEAVRNNIAHSQNDIASEISWETIFKTVEWVETFLANSDEQIELESKAGVKKYTTQLK
jgi:hypothetical protein